VDLFLLLLRSCFPLRGGGFLFCFLLVSIYFFMDLVRVRPTRNSGVPDLAHFPKKTHVGLRIFPLTKWRPPGVASGGKGCGSPSPVG